MTVVKRRSAARWGLRATGAPRLGLGRTRLRRPMRLTRSSRSTACSSVVGTSLSAHEPRPWFRTRAPRSDRGWHAPDSSCACRTCCSSRWAAWNLNPHYRTCIPCRYACSASGSLCQCRGLAFVCGTAARRTPWRLSLYSRVTPRETVYAD